MGFDIGWGGYLVVLAVVYLPYVVLAVAAGFLIRDAVKKKLRRSRVIVLVSAIVLFFVIRLLGGVI